MPSIDIPDMPGVYRITCTVNGRFYIGSSVNLRKRQTGHWYELSHKTHRNRHLQRAWNKYGEDAFVFEIIELILLPELLTAREQYWFKKLKPFGRRGFNLDRIAGSSLGLKRSLKTREKLRNFHLGKKLSAETKRRVGIAGLGRTMSPKSRALADARNVAHMKTLVVTSPDGKECIVHGINQFCREYNLSQSAIIGVAKGRCSQHKGWKARYLETNTT